MIKQRLVQLSAATSASNSDVMYIVKNYTPGSPTLTGTSHQIAFSSITSSYQKDFAFAVQGNDTVAPTESTISWLSGVTSGITLSGGTTFILNPSKSYLVSVRLYYNNFAGGNDGILVKFTNSAGSEYYGSSRFFGYAVTSSTNTNEETYTSIVLSNTNSLQLKHSTITGAGSANGVFFGRISIEEL